MSDEEQDYPHDGCQFADLKTAAELQAKFQEVGDEERIHLAIHHIDVMHGGFNRDHIQFFHDQPQTHELADMAIHIGSRLQKGLGEEMAKMVTEADDPSTAALVESVTGGNPIALMGFTLLMKSATTEIAAVSAFSFLAGASFQKFLSSNGEYCLWSEIDPTLCKD